MKLRIMKSSKLGILPVGCRLTKREFETLRKARLILSGLVGSAFKHKDKEVQLAADEANDVLKDVVILCNPKGRGGL